jgi:hypothetical protein
MRHDTKRLAATCRPAARALTAVEGRPREDRGDGDEEEMGIGIG